MNRRDLLVRTLTSLFETTKGIDVEAVVVIDCDESSLKACEDLRTTNGWNIVPDYSPTQRGAINCWNIGLAKARADIFFHQGDDLTYSDGWLDKALEAHRTKLNSFGLVGVNDSIHNGGQTVATHVLFDRAFCREHLGGIMAIPVVKYYGADVWLTEVAKRAGRFYWCEDAVVYHLHPCVGKREVDDTDKSHMDWFEEDVRKMDELRGAGFPITWEPVIT